MITKGEMTPQAVKGFEGEDKKRSWAGKGSDFLNLGADKVRNGFNKIVQAGGKASTVSMGAAEKAHNAVMAMGGNVAEVKARLAKPAIKPAKISRPVSRAGSNIYR